VVRGGGRLFNSVRSPLFGHIHCDALCCLSRQTLTQMYHEGADSTLDGLV
jgi:hypothetical protein